MAPTGFYCLHQHQIFENLGAKGILSDLRNLALNKNIELGFLSPIERQVHGPDAPDVDFPGTPRRRSSSSDDVLLSAIATLTSEVGHLRADLASANSRLQRIETKIQD